MRGNIGVSTNDKIKFVMKNRKDATLVLFACERNEVVVNANAKTTRM